ncbi:MAG: hypothetical protein ACPGQL_07910 [Thermoplasmatota archaeon]
MQRTTLLLGLLLIASVPAASATTDAIADSSDEEGAKAQGIPCTADHSFQAPSYYGARADCLGSFCFHVDGGGHVSYLLKPKTCDPKSRAVLVAGS